MKKTATIIFTVLVLVLAGFFLFVNTAKAPIQEIKETVAYTNASSDMIQVTSPIPGAVVPHTISLSGRARGTWFFEASFPIELLDVNGKHIGSAIAQAQGEWMTAEFVPFKASVSVPEGYSGKAKLILKKDNPSGIPEKDASISFSLTIE